MAFIEITTNNLSRELRNAQTFIDNWAYVPGTSITGDYTKVYAFTSLDEFKNACGAKGPEGSPTFNYVSGLLNSGIPVLFRRIACADQDGAHEVLGVVKASHTFQTEATSQAPSIDLFTVEEKFGGTFGNDISIMIKDTTTYYWLEVYLNSTLLEKHRLFKVPTFEDGTSQEDKQLVINQLFIDTFANPDFNSTLERINIILNKDFIDGTKTAADFNFKLPTKNQELTGGQDLDENLVRGSLKETYHFIEDKILYQPKFITSGGYTDLDMDSNKDIAQAMIDLTLLRQDCRALIDLPLGTDIGEQQGYAQDLGYQQLSDSQLIPSASICAPWAWMQVGTEQAWMPPSYIFLTVVGRDLSKGGQVYTPKAGLSNGQVVNIIRPEFEIGSTIAEKWQSDNQVNINPIMKLTNSGKYVIAGNSTILIPETESGEINAFQESSVDLTVIEIRRFVYNLGTELQYKYNSQDSFEDFALRTSEFLDRMESEGAVMDYEIYNMSSNDDPRTLKIKLNVYVTPTIKKIEINLNVAYGSIEVTGGEE